MTALLRYDAACRAIAEAVAIDEVLLIRDKADALRAAARVARNKEPQVQFAEIRFRAERRIGQLELDLKRDGLMDRGGRPAETGAQEEPVSKVGLADLGVDKKLSARAQKLAAIPPQRFEAMLGEWRERVSHENERVTVNLLKEGEQAQRRADHQARTQAGGKVDDLHALAASGFRAGAILADPAWQFITRSEKGEGRSASQHYDVQGLEAIKALPVGAIAADDCVLFMWMLDWCPHWAFDVIAAWGFEHKTTAFTWVKLTEGHEGTPRLDGVISDRDFHFGQGYWTRANPEDCWLATRGSPQRLNADVRQLIIHPVMEHSRKPDVHERIERLVGGPYIELNARRERAGWRTWGNEIPFTAPEIQCDEPFDQETGELSPAREAAE